MQLLNRPPSFLPGGELKAPTRKREYQDIDPRSNSTFYPKAPLEIEILRFFPRFVRDAGFDNDIPHSHTLRPRREADPDISHELLFCEGNWQGAESEASAGFLEEMPSLEAASACWGRDRVAVGKVSRAARCH